MGYKQQNNVIFLPKNCFLVRAQAKRKEKKILRKTGKPKNNVFNPFPYWGLKDSPSGEDSKFGSQNWVLIIFGPNLAKKNVKMHMNRDFRDVLICFVFGKNRVKYYSNKILRPELESSHQYEPIRPQNESGIDTLFSGFPLQIIQFAWPWVTLCDPGLTRPFSVVDLHDVKLQNCLDFWMTMIKLNECYTTLKVLASRCIFQTFISCARTKKAVFLLEKTALLCYSYPMTRD